MQTVFATSKEHAMNGRAKQRLSLTRETLRILTATETRAIAGAQGSVATEMYCEPTGVAGHCEMPSRAMGCGTHAPRPQVPGLTILQGRSLAYCVDRPPLSGFTLPPGAKD
jgi:hypothetical protein